MSEINYNKCFIKKSLFQLIKYFIVIKIIHMEYAELKTDK